MDIRAEGRHVTIEEGFAIGRDGKSVEEPPGGTLGCAKGFRGPTIREQIQLSGSRPEIIQPARRWREAAARHCPFRSNQFLLGPTRSRNPPDGPVYPRREINPLPIEGLDSVVGSALGNLYRRASRDRHLHKLRA